MAPIMPHQERAWSFVSSTHERSGSGRPAGVRDRLVPRGRPRRRSAAAAYVGPKVVEILIADLAAPGRHGLTLAVEHGVAESLEVVLGELAQVERDGAGRDHVAAMAGDAEFAVDLATLLGRIGRRFAIDGGTNHKRPVGRSNESANSAGSLCPAGRGLG